MRPPLVARTLGPAMPGATFVMDDFSAAGEGPDSRRKAWPPDERLVAKVVGTGGNAQAIVAVIRL